MLDYKYIKKSIKICIFWRGGGIIHYKLKFLYENNKNMATEMLWKKEDLHEVDWVKEQTKSALSSLQKEVLYTQEWDEVKFDVDTSLNYLQTLKDAKTWQEMTSKNSGATIMAIQILLKNKWYDVWKIDGILRTKWKTTSRTMDAVKQFQGKVWLKTDWIPWPQTLNKLLEEYTNEWAQSDEPQQQPTTPETQEVSDVTVDDLKNLDRKTLWSFDKNGNFVFKNWVEKSDNKWTYILVNGKKLYKTKYHDVNANWIFYFIVGWNLYYGQSKNGEMDWRGKFVFYQGAGMVYRSEGERRDGHSRTEVSYDDKGNVVEERKDGKQVKWK